MEPENRFVHRPCNFSPFKGHHPPAVITGCGETGRCLVHRPFLITHSRPGMFVTLVSLLLYHKSNHGVLNNLHGEVEEFFATTINLYGGV